MKSAIVFKAVLPNATELANHLKEILFTPVSEFSRVAYGFISNEITGEIVTPLIDNVGFAIQLRIDEKIIPRDVINKKVKEKIKLIYSDTGGDQKVTRKEKFEIQSDIMSEILPVALIKSTVLTGYYIAKNNTFIVDTGNKKHASRMMSMLIRCIGHVSTTTIHVSGVKEGVTTKVRERFCGNDYALKGFELGEKCTLVTPDKKKKTYINIDLDTQSDNILDDIESGMEVERISLSHSNVEFMLTNEFHLKSLRFPDCDETLESTEKEDKAYAWRHEVTVKSLFVSDIIELLCDLIGQKPESITVNDDNMLQSGPEHEESGKDHDDNLYSKVVDHVKGLQRCSVANIQRVFKLGYNSSARIVDQMEAEGIVSPAGENGVRTVLVE